MKRAAVATRSVADDTACYATSTAVHNTIMNLEKMAPINLMFITRPIDDMTVTRIKQLESFYACSRFTRFLLRKGVHPIGLFTVSTAALALVVRRLYRRSSYLMINTLGVAYPTWRCLKLIRQAEAKSPEEANIDELKSWLTYWLLYGSLQVLDNWGSLLKDLMPYYNIYKIAILYWAQNPQSKGATTLYNILRPIAAQPPVETQPSDTLQPYTLPKSMSIETIVKRTTETIPTPYEIKPNPIAHLDDEELTLTISSGGPGYGLMNGYTPSLSSEREDESEEDDDPDEISKSRHASVSSVAAASPKYNMLMQVADDTAAW
ncbi:hypothetical protein K450DRAFT_219546 [Umbelopsis ramanniana AG]|uniref:Protein YOP1 n=1 Tax=Umbelopsis ramanniana AG TaxID=1314678 RepID=A0AAD5EJM2_UMBRA|nr:uncharacterized protein K450DRAFT_219546 [Umbelopsis ramanniana AG]KAI8584375.1 hypothetical protein K450DRAFT_219546 [Umbelopsis ramanniana AG]